MGGCKEESLPLKYVHYPAHYGTFFAFSDTLDGEFFLCDCNRSAILNYFELRSKILEETTNHMHESIESIDKLYLPSGLQGISISKNSDPSKHLRFKKSICHRCNLIPPTMRYCHEMYGGAFKQHFGWYIKLNYLKFGILGDYFLENITPQEFINDLLFIKEANIELANSRKWFRDRDEQLTQGIINKQPPKETIKNDYDEIHKHQEILRISMTKQSRAIRTLSTKIENIVREEFGFKKIGEQWTSETLLYQIVENLFPSLVIHRHFRPSWLNKLELDIYIPSINLGFEYQGQQHYHAVTAWGGVEALIKLQERDTLKKEYCKSQGVELIIIDYTEPLTIEYIKSKIPNGYFISPNR